MDKPTIQKEAQINNIQKNLQIVQVDISALKSSEYNPRLANEKEYHDLKASLTRFGFVDPILVNSAEKRKNIIIGGHFRIKVAKDMGYKQAPVIYISIPDLEKEKELNLRLNKNLGQWDFDILANFFDEGFLNNVGFNDYELGISADGISKEVQDLGGEDKIILNKDKYAWLWIEFKDKATLVKIKNFFGLKNREIPEEKFLELFKKANIKL